MLPTNTKNQRIKKTNVTLLILISLLKLNATKKYPRYVGIKFTFISSDDIISGSINSLLNREANLIVIKEIITGNARYIILEKKQV